MEGLLNQYLDNYTLPDESKGWKGIQSKRFLKQCKDFGAKGKDDDLCVSYGWNLIIQQADKKVAKTADQAKPTTAYHYERSMNGMIRIVTNSTQNNQRRIPKSIFDVR